MADSIVVSNSEEWRPMVGFDGKYLVSNLGRASALLRGSQSCRKILRLSLCHGGYLKISLASRDGQVTRKIHRLVAEAFLGPCPDGMQVNHKDGDKHNNVICNLEYVTPKQNVQHALISGLRWKHLKLTDADVQTIRTRLESETPTEIAKEYGVSRGLISGIRNGYNRVEIAFVSA